MALCDHVGGMTRLSVRAPAKINLHLEVLGRRHDGFHELRTLYQSIDLCDELTAEPAPEGVLELAVRPRGAAPYGDDNLVIMAARSLQQAAGRSFGARLELDKAIPAGGGLGGGSADAAAALVLLNELWGTGFGRGQLVPIAARLGSDVPFFLHGGLALGVGRGEEVYPLADLTPLHVVVGLPETAVSTPGVFRRLECELTWRAPDSNVYAFTAGWDPRPPWEALRNDLQPVVIAGWPEVAGALAELARHRPLLAAVTGSGSSVFAIFSDRGAAQEAAVAAGRILRIHLGTTLERSAARLNVSRKER